MIHQQDVEHCIAVLQLLVTILFMSVQKGEGVSKRIVETAVFTMNNDSDSEEIQKLGIEMLEAFVSQEGDLMSFLELGGLDVILRAMRGGSEAIRISCSKLLVAAAKNEVVSKAIVQLEGVKMLLLVIKEHPKCAGMHQYAAEALALLAVSKEVSDLILEHDGLALLFASFKRFVKEEAVEASVTHILDRLMELCEEALHCVPSRVMRTS